MYAGFIVLSYTFRCYSLMTAFDRRNMYEERLYISYKYFVLQIAGFNNKKYFVFKEMNYIKIDNLNSMFVGTKGTNRSISRKKMGAKK